MIWSVSDSKTFRRCQRQWYYKHMAGSAIAKDAHRREIYLLSKLQSISSWRGQIVDTVISETVIPAVKNKRQITLDQAKATARKLAVRQLNCAKEHQLFAPNFSPSQKGDDFAAFHCMEYRGAVDESELAVAFAEIDAALSNFFRMNDVKELIKQSAYLVAQRPLSFPLADVTVRAVPDLVAFYDRRAPIIFDWKVHVFGINEAWLQLGIYAMALAQGKPHKDFPRLIFRDLHATNIEVVEAQLLTNNIRRYSLTDEEVERAEAYVAESATDMLLAIGDRKSTELMEEDFAVTRFESACQSCAFRRICWSSGSKQ